MSEQWEINWYICRDDDGKELWRIAKSIGPIAIDHNHWAGWHLTGTDQEHRLAGAAPDLLAALKAARDHLNYCGYGDKWERECARAAGLEVQIDTAIAKATGEHHETCT